ncbi:MAG: adenosylcobinamide-GDP ribazoletransferase [Candidatus Deferrimicrobiaceae bacterium]
MGRERFPVKSPFAAIRFLTRIRVPVGGLTEREIGRSAAFFPVVGLLIGGLLLGLYRLFGLFFPVPVARILVLTSLVAVSGAFHLDGLADAVDGLYGGRDRDDALRIMRDPHIGAMGATAVVMVLLLKTAAAVSLSEEAFRGGLLVMPVAGRGAMVAALLLPYARDEGLGLAFARHHSRADSVAAAIMILAAAFYFLGPAGLWALLGSLAAAGVVLWIAWHRIRGVTGDVCGAVNEVVECAFLMVLLAFASPFPVP